MTATASTASPRPSLRRRRASSPVSTTQTVKDQFGPSQHPAAPRAGRAGVLTRASDSAIAAALFVVASVVRFVDLARIDAVVFDEVHYGKFVSWLQTGHFFFNVHPPAGSLVIAAIAAAMRFDPSADSFSNPGDVLSSPAQAFAARTPAALLGSPHCPRSVFPMPIPSPLPPRLFPRRMLRPLRLHARRSVPSHHG
jgi:Dolichyl-phosphate-mannose-protein mannosyltransferase